MKSNDGRQFVTFEKQFAPEGLILVQEQGDLYQKTFGVCDASLHRHGNGMSVSRAANSCSNWKRFDGGTIVGATPIR